MVTIYQLTAHHILEDMNLHQHCCQNPKPRTIQVTAGKYHNKNSNLYQVLNKVFISVTSSLACKRTKLNQNQCQLLYII